MKSFDVSLIIMIILIILIAIGCFYVIYRYLLKKKVYCCDCKFYQVKKQYPCSYMENIYVSRTPLAPAHYKKEEQRFPWSNRDNHCKYYELKGNI